MTGTLTLLLISMTTKSVNVAVVLLDTGPPMVDDIHRPPLGCDDLLNVIRTQRHDVLATTVACLLVDAPEIDTKDQLRMHDLKDRGEVCPDVASLVATGDGGTRLIPTARKHEGLTHVLANVSFMKDLTFLDLDFFAVDHVSNVPLDRLEPCLELGTNLSQLITTISLEHVRRLV